MLPHTHQADYGKLERDDRTLLQRYLPYILTVAAGVVVGAVVAVVLQRTEWRAAADATLLQGANVRTVTGTPLAQDGYDLWPDKRPIEECLPILRDRASIALAQALAARPLPAHEYTIETLADEFAETVGVYWRGDVAQYQAYSLARGLTPDTTPELWEAPSNPFKNMAINAAGLVAVVSCWLGQEDPQTLRYSAINSANRDGRPFGPMPPREEQICIEIVMPAKMLDDEGKTFDGRASFEFTLTPKGWILTQTAAYDVPEQRGVIVPPP
ncbi:MAG: hypothetical protein JNK25_07695 [Phycisphaerae bacterium]|nr:hypothetical protein [Phycisphaerae bacterium]